MWASRASRPSHAAWPRRMSSRPIAAVVACGRDARQRCFGPTGSAAQASRLTACLVAVVVGLTIAVLVRTRGRGGRARAGRRAPMVYGVVERRACRRPLLVVADLGPRLLAISGMFAARLYQRYRVPSGIPLSVASRDTGTARGPSSRAAIRAQTVSEYSFISLHRFSPRGQIRGPSTCRVEAATTLGGGGPGAL